MRFIYAANHPLACQFVLFQIVNICKLNTEILMKLARRIVQAWILVFVFPAQGLLSHKIASFVELLQSQ